ncbi:response regulator [Desulfoluna sp.]|uniref:response regulator n=1 Tax=Desulfoluna sp. TaxID=2045199 RepID=UPI00261AC30A|nr:response regulator [Desulfoluna sp.]
MEPKANILVVDDNTIILLGMMTMYLSGKQYHVMPAKSEVEGLKLFNSHADIIDLIRTDLIMPDISGAALISIIKNNTPNLPSIAISGFGEHPIPDISRVGCAHMQGIRAEDVVVYLKALITPQMSAPGSPEG